MKHLALVVALIVLFPLGWLASKRPCMALVVGMVVSTQCVVLAAILWWVVTGEEILLL